jgi:hypothetical protein
MGLLDFLEQRRNGGLLSAMFPEPQSFADAGPAVPDFPGATGHWLGSNGSTPSGLGAGIAGGSSWGDGLSNSFPNALAGGMFDPRHAGQSRTVATLMNHGLDEDTARAAAGNPTMLRAVLWQLHAPLERPPSSPDEPAPAPIVANAGVPATPAPPTAPAFPQHLDSARYWGAARTPAGTEPMPSSSYLAPVPRAPRWEQVVPSETPWSVSPQLPSPTSWGNVVSGPECRKSGGNLHCISAGGRQVTVPDDAFPNELGIAPGHPDYHYYDIPVSSPHGDPERLTAGVIRVPTPAPRVRPASAEGTPNAAAPLPGSLLSLIARQFGWEHSPSWPVKSYVTTDQSGTPVVVNVTQPGHPLYPGVVMRYVTTSPSGSTIQNEGIGTEWWQGPRSYLPEWLRNWANDYAWFGPSQETISRNSRPLATRGLSEPSE